MRFYSAAQRPQGSQAASHPRIADLNLDVDTRADFTYCTVVRRQICGTGGRTMILLQVALVCAAAGCVQLHPTRSGFLGDYSELMPLDKKDRVRVKPVAAAALADVDSFYIEPVAWLADDMGLPARSPADEEAIRSSLQEALSSALGSIRPLVDEVGPRTAVVRAAVTGVQESLPLVNLLLVTQIVGPLFNGGAAAEIEVIGPSGAQIAAESAAYRGQDWDVVGFFWWPTHAESALRRAAKQLADDLTAGSSPASR